ncbi:YciI family protein [Bacillus sp. ISL-39]|uniref:YciI family protein n=1 Tax=Bacillus sp. ISL-39 TaxID=2819124 RepID=UPI001BED0813|nr:YciI family protein [Bacillus sp. ISL-39]MBT2637567.1 hypothetical protein [Bacillus sp. ISL-39]
MKKFVVFLKDKRKGKLEPSLLTRHIEHLRNLNQEGKLMVGGPFKNNEQAMVILNCDDIDEALKIFANEENNWLIDSPQTTRNLVH